MNSYQNITHVYSSPLRRAVITGRITMETYPNLEKNNTVFKVIPWFRETMKSQCDLAYYTKKV